MEITKAKIYKAAATDKTRPVLTGVYFDANSKVLVAADGFIMAVCPVSKANGDESGIIPADAIRAAHKAAGRTGTPALVVGDNSVMVGAVKDGEEELEGPIYPLIEGHFPDFQQIVPLESSLEFLIALDVNKLKAVADAIGAQKINLYQAPGFNKENPIVVRERAWNGAEPSQSLGVLMPLKPPESRS